MDGPGPVMGPVDRGWSGKGCSKGEGTVSLVLVTRRESQHILALGNRVGSCVVSRVLWFLRRARECWQGRKGKPGQAPFSCMSSSDAASASGSGVSAVHMSKVVT